MSEALRLADVLQNGCNFYHESSLTFDSDLADAAQDAADVLRQLSAELEECQAQRRAAFRRIEEQDAELENVRKDAERYRWLQKEHARHDPLCHLSWKKNNDRHGSEWVNTAQIDSAIDAAMKGTP